MSTCLSNRSTGWVRLEDWRWKSRRVRCVCLTTLVTCSLLLLVTLLPAGLVYVEYYEVGRSGAVCLARLLLITNSDTELCLCVLTNSFSSSHGGVKDKGSHLETFSHFCFNDISWPNKLYPKFLVNHLWNPQCFHDCRWRWWETQSAGEWTDRRPTTPGATCSSRGQSWFGSGARRTRWTLPWKLGLQTVWPLTSHCPYNTSSSRNGCLL